MSAESTVSATRAVQFLDSDKQAVEGVIVRKADGRNVVYEAYGADDEERTDPWGQLSATAKKGCLWINTMHNLSVDVTGIGKALFESAKQECISRKKPAIKFLAIDNSHVFYHNSGCTVIKTKNVNKKEVQKIIQDAAATAKKEKTRADTSYLGALKMGMSLPTTTTVSSAG